MLFFYHLAAHKAREVSAIQPSTPTQFRVQWADLPKNADVVLYPTAKGCLHHPFPGVPFTKDTEKTLATGRIAQQVPSWACCYFKSYSPLTGMPWRAQILHSQVTRTEIKEEGDVSKKCHDLLSAPILTSKANTKKKKSKQLKSSVLQFVKTNCDHWGLHSKALRHGVFALF